MSGSGSGLMGTIVRVLDPCVYSSSNASTMIQANEIVCLCVAQMSEISSARSMFSSWSSSIAVLVL